MRKLFFLSLTLILFLGCKKEDDVVVAPTEFVLQPSDVANFKNWTYDGDTLRADKLEFRRIYINKASEVDRVSGIYPQGTIIVKEICNQPDTLAAPSTQVKRYQIMSKRGGNFNKDANGWEWILTDANISNFTARGGNEMMVNGATCISCHQPKSASDFTFTDY